MSSPCPTLAAACWVARSRGRADRPSGSRPAAIAPEETSTIWQPPATRPASTSTRASTRSPSSPPGVPETAVSDDEPTLTTTRRAATTAARIALAAFEPQVGAARAQVLGARRQRGFPVEHHTSLAADDDIVPRLRPGGPQ